MPSDPVSLKADKTQSWAVTVERNGESVVSLASNCQGGRDLSAEDERVIRLTAGHLLAFIGEAHVPSPVSSTGAEQEIKDLKADLAAWQESHIEEAGYVAELEAKIEASIVPEQSEDSELVAAITAIVREADKTFERVGGSSRHWVRDCFLPCLNKAGWRVSALRDSSPRTGSEGWQCQDDHHYFGDGTREPKDGDVCNCGHAK